MKITVVLPSYIYNVIRAKLAHDAFESLARCKLMVDTRLLLLYKPAAYVYPIQELSKAFEDVLFTEEPQGIGGTEQTLAHGTERAFEEGAEYVTWMGDDALFHPEWLHALVGLIERHPAARSWSVYRSAYEAVHKTLRETEQDVQVASICGHGLTFSAAEWKALDVEWKTNVCWPSPMGNTLDLYHVWRRPGERWCTKDSYVEHTGRQGLHCNPSIPEYAKNWLGG